MTGSCRNWSRIIKGKKIYYDGMNRRPFHVDGYKNPVLILRETKDKSYTDEMIEDICYDAYLNGVHGKIDLRIYRKNGVVNWFHLTPKDIFPKEDSEDVLQRILKIGKRGN